MTKLPIMEVITAELQELGYIIHTARHPIPSTKKYLADRIAIMNEALTKTITICIRLDTPNLISLMHPRQDIDLTDPESIPALYEAIAERFKDAPG